MFGFVDPYHSPANILFSFKILAIEIEAHVTNYDYNIAGADPGFSERGV